MKTTAPLLLALVILAISPETFAGPPAPDCCTSEFGQRVMQSYRSLKIQGSVYEQQPAQGQGLRLGICQAQAAYGPGASAKNRDRLEQAARTAHGLGVQLLASPELSVPGYTLSQNTALSQGQPARALRAPEGARGAVSARRLEIPDLRGWQRSRPSEIARTPQAFCLASQAVELRGEAGYGFHRVGNSRSITSAAAWEGRQWQRLS